VPNKTVLHGVVNRRESERQLLQRVDGHWSERISGPAVCIGRSSVTRAYLQVTFGLGILSHWR
jgi:hypothetical protein